MGGRAERIRFWQSCATLSAMWRERESGVALAADRERSASTACPLMVSHGNAVSPLPSQPKDAVDDTVAGRYHRRYAGGVVRTSSRAGRSGGEVDRAMAGGSTLSVGIGCVP